MRDAVQNGILVTDHIRTYEQIADILPKAHGRVPFHTLFFKLGIQNLHTPI